MEAASVEKNFENIKNCDSDVIQNSGIQSVELEDLHAYNEQILMNLKPEKPNDSDCCGSGCIPCVFDIYEQELKIWENECIKFKNKAKFGDTYLSEKPVLSELEYKQFFISSIDNETHDTKRFRFIIPNNGSLGLKVGQHIIIRAQSGSETITRQYTPISNITCRGHFDLLIKLYENGKMSKVIKKWQVGDKIDIRGPFGTFQYFLGKSSYILMLAAGTGIAPMSQVIQHILDNENDETFIYLLYACHTYQDILMKKELNDWSGYWNFSVTYVLSQEENGQYRFGDKIYKGKIDHNLIKTEMDNKTLDRGLVLVCGPRSFDQDMIEHCQNVGFNTQQIFKF